MKKTIQKSILALGFMIGGLATGAAIANNVEIYDFPNMEACMAHCEGSCSSVGGGARCFWRIK